MRGFRFFQVLKSGPRRSCLLPKAAEAPLHTREKTSGTQGRTVKVILAVGQS